MTDPGSKRRWLAFRLRTMLVIVVVLACVLTPVAIKMKRARDQARIVAWVVERGGDVVYDWQPVDWSPWEDRGTPPGPAWLRRLMGDDFFQRVREVDLDNHHGEADVNDLNTLSGLTSLRVLRIQMTKVTDLSPLSGLRDLRVLNLYHTRVRDLWPLSGLVHLEELYCAGTDVIDLTPLSNLKRLRVLDLQRTDVADLAVLKKLPVLERLYLDEVTDYTPLVGLTNLRVLAVPFASDDELQRLEKALPNCKVRRW